MNALIEFILDILKFNNNGQQQFKSFVLKT